eukprot:5977954-Pyramimonas_sp.AAC.1
MTSGFIRFDTACRERYGNKRSSARSVSVILRIGADTNPPQSPSAPVRLPAPTIGQQNPNQDALAT